MLKEFLAFIKKGNIVDLAVAVVIGAAFSLVINSLVDDIINPIIAGIIGKPDMSDMTLTIGDAVIKYGSFLTAIINFLIVAAAIFFLVIKPMQGMTARMAVGADGEPLTVSCPECLGIIPTGASRCMHCGQPQALVDRLPR